MLSLVGGRCQKIPFFFELEKMFHKGMRRKGFADAFELQRNVLDWAYRDQSEVIGSCPIEEQCIGRSQRCWFSTVRVSQRDLRRFDSQISGKNDPKLATPADESTAFHFVQEALGVKRFQDRKVRAKMTNERKIEREFPQMHFVQSKDRGVRRAGPVQLFKRL